MNSAKAPALDAGATAAASSLSATTTNTTNSSNPAAPGPSEQAQLDIIISLMDQNYAILNAFKANMQLCKVAENTDLLARYRDNVQACLTHIGAMGGTMAQMPPLPVQPNLELASKFLPPKNMPSFHPMGMPSSGMPPFPFNPAAGMGMPPGGMPMMFPPMGMPPGGMPGGMMGFQGQPGMLPPGLMQQFPPMGMMPFGAMPDAGQTQMQGHLGRAASMGHVTSSRPAAASQPVPVMMTAATAAVGTYASSPQQSSSHCNISGYSNAS